MSYVETFDQFTKTFLIFAVDSTLKTLDLEEKRAIKTMHQQLSNHQLLLNEARTCLSSDADLFIKCDNNEKFQTSRLLFALLLQPELQTELLLNENSYLVFQDIKLR